MNISVCLASFLVVVGAISSECRAAEGEPTGLVPLPSAFLRTKLDMPPRYADLKQLRPEHKAALIEQFRTTALSNKVASAWALAYLSGDEVLELLKEPLEADYHQRELSRAELVALLGIVRSIGVLGQKSDAAFEYLRASGSREVWVNRIKWRADSRMVGKNPELRFTGFTAEAIGLTGHRDAMQALTEMIKLNEAELGKIAGNIDAGVFYLWCINENGKEGLLKLFSSEEHDLESELEAFRRTEVGNAWRKWYYSKKGLPLPDRAGDRR